MAVKFCGNRMDALTVSGHCHSRNACVAPEASTDVGEGLFMYHCTTSIQCVIKSVKIPPPKSQKKRQRRYRMDSNGWSGAAPRNFFQSSRLGSISASGSYHVVRT